jgi:hypothetical protein
VDDELAGPARLRGKRVEVTAEQRRLGDERGDRCPQLVRDVGDEPPVLGLGGLEPDDRVFEGVRHPVEAGRPLAELVRGGDRDARRQVAAGDPLGGQARLVDRREDAPGDDPGRDDREEGEDQAADPEREAELVEG